MNPAPRYQRTPSPSPSPREAQRTVARQAQDWQFPSRNRLGRAAECSVWNAVAKIQAGVTPPTIRMVATYIDKDYRQVKRILKRMEKAGLLEWRHKEAVYKSNRLQYVPIVLKWANLRQIEPTPTSPREPTPPKSLGVKCSGHSSVSVKSSSPLPPPETRATKTDDAKPSSQEKAQIKGRNTAVASWMKQKDLDGPLWTAAVILHIESRRKLKTPHNPFGYWKTCLANLTPEENGELLDQVNFRFDQRRSAELRGDSRCCEHGDIRSECVLCAEQQSRGSVAGTPHESPKEAQT
jgi:hypothetical protein